MPDESQERQRDWEDRAVQDLLASALGSGLIALREADASDATFEQALRQALVGIEEHSEANRTVLEAVILFVYRLVAHHRKPRELAVLTRLAEQELKSDRKRRVEEILMTGAEALIQQGVQQGEAKMVLQVASRQFGAVPEMVQARVARLPSAYLEALMAAMFDLKDVRSLEAWLDERGGAEA